jgi:hypothetical protein
MNKAIETLLTTPSARNSTTLKQVALSASTFTPWEGTTE